MGELDFPINFGSYPYASQHSSLGSVDLRLLAISCGNGGGLDAYGMMTGDDTGRDVWTVAGAGQGMACSRGSP